MTNAGGPGRKPDPDDGFLDEAGSSSSSAPEEPASLAPAGDEGGVEFAEDAGNAPTHEPELVTDTAGDPSAAGPLADASDAPDPYEFKDDGQSDSSTWSDLPTTAATPPPKPVSPLAHIPVSPLAHIADRPRVEPPPPAKPQPVPRPPVLGERRTPAPDAPPALRPRVEILPLAKTKPAPTPVVAQAPVAPPPVVHQAPVVPPPVVHQAPAAAAPVAHPAAAAHPTPSQPHPDAKPPTGKAPTTKMDRNLLDEIFQRAKKIKGDEPK